MGKRAKGEGALYLRGDGRWEAQLRIGVGRRKPVYGRTRCEVLGQLREARWALKRGLPVSSRKLTLAACLASWLELVKGRVRASTFESHELNVRRIEEELGELPLGALTPMLIEASYQPLVREGSAPAACSRSIACCIALSPTPSTWASSSAIRSCSSIRPGLVVGHRPRPGREQRLVLLDETRADRLHALWVLLGTAGLRIGEAPGLRWEDVDLLAGRVSIQRALQRRPR